MKLIFIPNRQKTQQNDELKLKLQKENENLKAKQHK